MESRSRIPPPSGGGSNGSVGRSSSVHPTRAIRRLDGSTQAPVDQEVESEAPIVTGKQVLSLSDSGNFRPSLKVRAAMIDIFQSHQHPAGYCWTAVNDDTRDFYWGEFMKRYSWNEETLNSTIVKELWLKIAGNAYRDYVSRIKRLYYSEHQKDRDKIQLQENVLESWVTSWELPEVKAKSEQGRKNRFAEPAGPGTGYFIHHGGSKSAEAYAEEMAEEKNCPPSECLVDTHLYFHFKNGVWTDKRAQWVMRNHLGTDGRRRPSSPSIPASSPSLASVFNFKVVNPNL